MGPTHSRVRARSTVIERLLLIVMVSAGLGPVMLPGQDDKEQARQVVVGLNDRNPAVRKANAYTVFSDSSLMAQGQVREALYQELQSQYRMVHAPGYDVQRYADVDPESDYLVDLIDNLAWAKDSATFRFLVSNKEVEHLWPYGRDALPTIFSLMADPDQVARDRGVRALNKLSATGDGLGRFSKEELESIRSVLIGLLHDSNEPVRVSAVRTLVLFDDPEVTRSLALAAETDPDVQSEVREALDEIRIRKLAEGSGSIDADKASLKTGDHKSTALAEKYPHSIPAARPAEIAAVKARGFDGAARREVLIRLLDEMSKAGEGGKAESALAIRGMFRREDVSLLVGLVLDGTMSLNVRRAALKVFEEMTATGDQIRT